MLLACVDLIPVGDPRGLASNPLTMVIYGAIACGVALWLVRRWRAKRDGE